MIGLVGRRTVDSCHIGPYLGGGKLLASGDVVTGADVARENEVSPRQSHPGGNRCSWV